jgi:two-component system, NarL family, sensor kinase
MKFLSSFFVLVLIFSCQENIQKSVSEVQNTQDSTAIAINYEKASKNKDSNQYYLDAAKKVMLKNGGQRCLVSLLFLEGKRELMGSKLDAVTQIADSGLRINLSHENKLFKGKFYNLKGNVAGFKRNVYQSLEYYTEAEKIFLETKEWGALAGIYSNITNAYFSLKDYKTGLEYSSKAYNLKKFVQEDRIRTNITIIHALALTKNNRFEKALKIQLEADSISNITNDIVTKLSVAIGYAEIYKATNKFELASLNYEKCIALSKVSGIKHFELMSNIGLLSLYEQKNENNKLLQNADSTILLAKSLNNVDVLHTTQRIIGRAHAKNNNFQKAFENLNASYMLYDSTSGVENQKNINELRVKYKVEKSEKDRLKQNLLFAKQKEQLQKSRILLGLLGILLVGLFSVIFVRRKLNKARVYQLNLENNQRIQKALIDGEEKERLRLAHEIHDGIASMLTGITYKISGDQSEKSEILDLLKSLHEDTRKIAHNMMPIDFKKTNLGMALQQLCEKMTSSEIEVLMAGIREKFDISVQKSYVIYRTVQELVNNALKHAQCKTVFVKMVKLQNEVILSVEDDGIGITESQKQNGLTNIKERIQLLQGVLKIEGSENKGTIVEIRLVP